MIHSLWKAYIFLLLPLWSFLRPRSVNTKDALRGEDRGQGKVLTHWVGGFQGPSYGLEEEAKLCVGASPQCNGCWDRWVMAGITKDLVQESRPFRLDHKVVLPKCLHNQCTFRFFLTSLLKTVYYVFSICILSIWI